MVARGEATPAPAARLACLAAIVLAASCGPSDGPDGDADADLDGDLEREADLDAVGDADAEPDRDADDDGDREGDTELPADADADGGGDRIESLVTILTDPATTEAQADALLHEVAWSDGWPVGQDGQWLFATRWDEAGGEVSLVSDINGWSPGTHRAATGPGGVFHYVVVSEGSMAAPVQGAKYKWHDAAGDVYRSPPESRAYGFDEHGLHGWVRPPVGEPHLERFPAMESAFLPPRTLRAYLPPGLSPGSAGAAAARVLLLHDGQNVFHPDAPWGGWRVDQALADGGYDDVVALAVDSVGDRMEVYTHVPDVIEAGGAAVGGQADLYLSMLREEVLPFFREQYGIAAHGQGLMVAGSSLGGLVTVYMGLIDQEAQGCVAALSPTLGWGAFDPASPADQALVTLWPSAVGHGPMAIYLDSGGGPGSGCVDLDGDGVMEDGDGLDNYCVTAQMRDVLVGLGYGFDVDLWHWWEPDAPHNEAAWADRFSQALAACDEAGWAGP